MEPEFHHSIKILVVIDLKAFTVLFLCLIFIDEQI